MAACDFEEGKSQTVGREAALKEETSYLTHRMLGHCNS